MFLSASAEDVKEAVNAGFPAGTVLGQCNTDDEDDDDWDLDEEDDDFDLDDDFVNISEESDVEEADADKITAKTE